MVDFNNETTIGTPAADVVRILILEKREYFLNAQESYIVAVGKGINAEPYAVKARLHTLFLELQAAFKRKLPPEEYAWLLDRVRNPETFGDMVDTYMYINEWLDDMRIIRLDTKKQYDSTRVIDEDTEKGL